MTGKEIIYRAKEIGSKCVYWYGGKRQTPTLQLANALAKQNPSVWTDEYFEAAIKDIGSGKLVCDCSGLVCGAYGVADIGTSSMPKKFLAMTSIPAQGHFTPGTIAWKKGHCGIILDTFGHIAEMRGLRWDFRTNRTFSSCGFTHILYSPDVDYALTPPGQWKQDDIGWYYVKPDGKYARLEFLKINGSWYYFNSSAYLQIGYFKLNNKRYYSTENGLLKSAVTASTELSAYELIH